MKQIIMLLFAALMLTASPALSGEVAIMEIDELKTMLNGEDLVVLDARTGRDWSTSEFKIPGALRAASSDYSTWSKSLAKDKKVVLYCA